MADLLASAWLSITRHRLRSLLAMAGVAVGVCALTSIMSVEQAWRKAVTEFFAPLGMETVRVTIPGWGGRQGQAQLRKAELDQTDVRAIVRQCPAVSAATLVTSGTLRVEGDAGGLEITTYAVAPDFVRTLPDEVQEGRLFSAEEVAGRNPVCLLSFVARLQLFGDSPVLAQHVRIGGHRFRVVGVIAGNRHVGLESCAVYIPETWTRAVLPSRRWDATECFARTQNPNAAVDQIERLMRQRIGGDGSQPFTHSLWQVREAALHARDRATAYSALAGLCALLAAGIGIASLLFVSVAERSQEIGVHRALGASRAHIYGEYVLASVMLSGGGAFVGAIAGIPAAAAGAFSTRWQPVLDPLAGEFLTAGAGQLPKLSEIALSVAWQPVIIAMTLAVITGVVAALTPAAEAAAVNPAAAIAARPGTRGRLRDVLTCLQVGFGVIVLVVLTSYYALLDNEEKTEARRALGQDAVTATADPIAAMREPVEQRYIDACNDAVAEAFSSPAAVARLRQQTPLLTDVTVLAKLPLSLSHGGRVGHGLIVATTDPFRDDSGAAADAGEHGVEAFRAGEPVTVINPETRDELFGRQDPVGQSLIIGGRRFTVVAVRLNPPGCAGVFVWVPIAHYPALRLRSASEQAILGIGNPHVEGRPIDPRRYAEALAQLRAALLPILPEEYRKSIVFSEQIPETTKQFIFQTKAVAVRGAVGALAVLLVALIGLTNMLLVSVHDELRETSLRRALGATRPDVFLHFLSQGVLLSALGAGAGLAISTAICAATRSWVGMPISVSAFWAAAGALATVLAGTLVCLVPALVGARIQPVEALRYE